MFEFYCGGFAAVPLARGSDLWLEPAQFEAARTDRQFHLYLVENIRQGDPRLFRLIDLHGQQLDRLLSRARERRYYTVPWPVAGYDAAIRPVP